MTLHWTRCICGLRVVNHYHDGRVLSCEDAALAHRYAQVKFVPLRELMLASLGGQTARGQERHSERRAS